MNIYGFSLGSSNSLNGILLGAFKVKFHWRFSFFVISFTYTGGSYLKQQNTLVCIIY